MLAALVCVPGTSRAVESAAEPGPVRVMLLGDSITQGAAGDWTWRYRLWHHLSGADVAFDLVGPRSDLRDDIGHAFGNQDYVDPSFDRDHAARWGMRLGSMDVPVATLMADHQPDVMVALIGDNDLSDGVPAADVAAMLRDVVLDARSADPGVDVVLATDPRPHLQPGAPAYNDAVRALVDELDAAGSRVVLADTAVDYDENTDTYDGAHPNSHGELKIAAAVEDALHELGVGPPSPPLPLGSTPRGPRIPPVLSATATSDGADLTWVRSPGAHTSDVWARDVTAGEGWHRVATGVGDLSHTVAGFAAGHHLQLRTVPYKGFWPAEPDAWSRAAEVNAPPPLVPDTGSANILLIGDSGTIGSTGDWTWRYRLWKHLQATASRPVDFVGPRDDVFDQRTSSYGHHTYADPGFDGDHAARWGLTFAFPETPIEQVVAERDVDVVVEMLGADDLAFLHHSPDRVADDLRAFVASARGANPDVDVVVGQVTQTWVTGAAELNSLLPGLVSDLDDPQSRVVLAQTAAGFSRRQDTYDNSHANATGEVKIAAAIADALATTGLGTGVARPLPSVPVGPRYPVSLAGEARDGKLFLRWTPSPGADSYRVLVKRPGQHRWARVAATERRRVTLRGLTAGRRVVLVVLPRKGRDLAALDVRSNRVSLRP